MSLAVKSLRKSYGIIKSHEVLRGLSFEIESGGIYSLIGQNGVGKTTTIKCILKFIKKTSGEIKFNEKDLSYIMDKSKVGYLPEVLLFTGLVTAKEYLRDLGILKGMNYKYIDKKVSELSGYLEIAEDLNRPISDFSKGMKKKIGFMQAVMNDPEFLILDEPTDGLDPVSRRKILSYIRNMGDNGTTILITSHILADLEEISDKVGLVSRGMLVSEINPKVFIDSTQGFEILVETEKNMGVEKKLYKLTGNEKLEFQNIDKLSILDIKAKIRSLEDWYFDVLEREGENSG